MVSVESKLQKFQIFEYLLFFLNVYYINLVLITSTQIFINLEDKLFFGLFIQELWKRWICLESMSSGNKEIS